MSRSLILVGAAVALIAGCGSRSIAAVDGFERWKQSEIASYSFTLQQSCFCDESVLAPKRIVVRDGRIVSVVLLDQGGGKKEEVLEDEFADVGARNLDELYALSVAASRDGEDVEVEFDELSGVPSTIIFKSSAIDGQVSISIEEFQIGTGI